MGDDTKRLRKLLAKATSIARAPGYWVTRCGRILSTIPWRGSRLRELRAFPNSHGYPSVKAHVNGRAFKLLVHKEVARAFLPPRPSEQHEVRHLNGNPLDNRTENLAWGTRKENAADRDTHGRTARGDRNGMRKYPERSSLYRRARRAGEQQCA